MGSSEAANPVHPRACGEQASGVLALREPETRSRFIPAPAGNSLLVLLGQTCENIRFIPAPAGNRIAMHPAAPSRFADGSSPRLRGTGLRAASSGHHRLGFGSSPRLRGTEVEVSWDPACTPVSVHPRACGEQGSAAASSGSVTCSSPRLRGTEVEVSAACPQCRFIPAPAGNRRLTGRACGFNR